MTSFSSLIDVQTSLVVAAGLGTALAVKGVSDRRKRNPRGLPYPPGPKGLPIIGNLLQVPTEKPWHAYIDLCKEYGDLVYLEALGQGIVVLGSKSRTNDLMEKRAMNYSDRPSIPVVDLMDMNWSFGVMQYGPLWRQHRRAFHQHLNHNAVANYYPIMDEERISFLRTLAKNPSNFARDIQLFFGAIIIRSTYGFDDSGHNKTLAHEAETVADAFTEATLPASFLVNMVPALRHIPDWFPGAGWKRYCREVSDLSYKVVHSPFESAQENINNGKASEYPSLVADLLDDLPDENSPDRAHSEKVARNVCAVAYVAGADTTVTSATVVMHVLATHPEIQKKAKAEIGRVIGPDRLPFIDDRRDLPYVHAFVKEISRWYTVTPLAGAHVSAEDDEYDGYFIPKGSYIIGNAWAIMHDPEVFEKPLEFMPERFLKDGKVDPTAPDAETAAFGFGRRMCPGRHFSNDALFLFTSSILSMFDVTPPKDEAGNFVKMKLETNSGSIAKPLPFKVDITLRPGRERLLQ